MNSWDKIVPYDIEISILLMLHYITDFLTGTTLTSYH